MWALILVLYKVNFALHSHQFWTIRSTVARPFSPRGFRHLVTMECWYFTMSTSKYTIRHFYSYFDGLMRLSIFFIDFKQPSSSLLRLVGLLTVWRRTRIWYTLMNWPQTVLNVPAKQFVWHIEILTCFRRYAWHSSWYLHLRRPLLPYKPNILAKNCGILSQ